MSQLIKSCRQHKTTMRRKDFKMKKMLSLLLVSVLFLGTIFPVYADEEQNLIGDVDKKNELVERVQNQNKGIRAKATISRDAKLDIIKAISKGEAFYTESELNNMGIYTLDTGLNSGYTPMSAPSDVSMTNVSCYYFNDSDEWVLNGTGKWQNDNWQDNLVMDTTTGYKKNVGNNDYLGITLYDTGTAPYRLDLKSSSHAWVEDKLGKLSSLNLRTPSNYNVEDGVVYEFQDVFSWERGLTGFKNPNYLGYKFGVIAVYNGAFKDYSGKAKLFYGHTWKLGEITGISLGIESDSIGMEVDYSVSENCFFGFSTSACYY